MFKKKEKNTGKLIGPDDFKVISLIGKGAFGKVWLVEEISTGKEYAMKVMSKRDIIAHDYVDHTNREREIMSDLSGTPFVTDLSYSFQTETSVYLVMNFVGGGSLFQYISELPKPLKESRVKFYLAQTLLALQQLHEKNVVYRDLKLENILLDEAGYIQFSDFGLSVVLKKNEKCNSFSGTKTYLAPEVLEGKHDHRVDYWAVGVLAFIMLTLEPPFYSENSAEMFEQIKEAKIEYSNFPRLSTNANTFLRQTLQPDPNIRLGSQNGIEDFKEHPFFKDVDWRKLLHRKIKAPYIPTIQRGERVVFNRTIDVESIDGDTDGCIDPIDIFGGFSFVSGHSKTTDTSKEVGIPGNKKGKSKTKSPKDQLLVEFAIEIQRCDGLQEKNNGSKFYVKWSCDSKKVSDGKSYSAICGDRSVVWSSLNGDNLARFVTTMYRDNSGNIDERILTLSLRDSSDKSIGSVKLNLADYSDHQLHQQQIFALSKTATITCVCSATWQLFNSCELVPCSDTSGIDSNSILEIKGKTYQLVPDEEKKLSRSSSKKSLKRVTSNIKLRSESSNTTISTGDTTSTEESSSTKKKKRRLSKIVSGTSKSFKKKLTQDGNESAENSIEEVDSEIEDSEVSEDSDVKLRGKKKKSIKRAHSMKYTTNASSSATEVDSKASSQFKKRKGLNTIKIRFDMILLTVTHLPSKCVGKNLQVTWKRGTKAYNSGKSEKIDCSGSSVTLNTSLNLQCSLYQQQQPPFSFEEQNLLLSLRYESAPGKWSPLAKGTFDLAQFSTDDADHEKEIELKNSKGLAVRVAMKCHTSWISVNDDPIAGASPIDTSSDSGGKRLSRVLSFKSWKKPSATHAELNNPSEDNEIKDLRVINNSLQAKIEELTKQLDSARSTSSVLSDGETTKEIPSFDKDTQNELKEIQEKHQTELTILESKVKQLADDLDSSQKLHKEQIKQIEELQSTKEAIEQNTAEIEEKRIGTLKELEDMKKSLSKMERSNNKKKETINTLTQQVAEANNKLTESAEQLKLRQVNDSELVAGTQAMLDEKLKELETLRTEHQSLQNERDLLKNEKKKAKKKTAAVAAELAALIAVKSSSDGKEQKIQQQEKTIKKLERTKKKLQNQLHELQQSSDDLTFTLTSVENDREKYSNDVIQFKKQVESLNETISVIERECDSAKATAVDHLNTIENEREKYSKNIKHLEEQLAKATESQREFEAEKEKILFLSQKLEDENRSLSLARDMAFNDDSKIHSMVETQQKELNEKNEKNLEELHVKHQQELQDLNDRYNDQSKELQNLQDELEAIQLQNREMNSSRSIPTEFPRETTTTTNNHSELYSKLERKREKNKILTEQLFAVKAECDSLRELSGGDTLKKQREELEEKLDAKTKNLEIVQEKLSLLEEEFETLTERCKVLVERDENSDGEIREKLEKKTKKVFALKEQLAVLEKRCVAIEHHNIDVLPDNQESVDSSQLEEKLFNARKDTNLLRFLVDKIYTCPLVFCEGSDTPLITKRIIERVEEMENRGEEISEFLSLLVLSVAPLSKPSTKDLFVQGYWLCSMYKLLQYLQETKKFKFREYCFDDLFFDEISSDDESSDNISDDETDSESEETKIRSPQCQKEIEKLIMNCVDLILATCGSLLSLPCRQCFFSGSNVVLSLSSHRQENKERELNKTLREIVTKLRNAKLCVEICDRLIEGVFEYINALIFNELMAESECCTAEIGLNIKLVLSQLTGWTANSTVLHEITSNTCCPLELHQRLMPLTHAANALVVLPNVTMDDFLSPDDLFETFSALSVVQLNQLVQQFTFTLKSREEISNTIKQTIQQQADTIERTEDDILFEYPFYMETGNLGSPRRK